MSAIDAFALNRASAAVAPLGLLIVDSHSLMRAGLRSVVEKVDCVRVAAEASGGYAAMMACRQNRIEIALIGQTLDDMDLVEAVEALLAQRPSLRIIVCFDRLDAREAAQLLHSGVTGLVSRASSPAEVAEALRTAAAGGTFIPSGLARTLFRNPAPVANIASGGLSARELEVLRLVALGFSNKDIAKRLDLSVRTVETHRFNLRQKSGASRPRELTRLARRLGLLAHDDEPAHAAAPALASLGAAAAFSALALFGAVPEAQAQIAPSIDVIDQDLRDVLTEFARTQGLRADIASDLRQRVMHESLPADPKAFVKRINREFDAIVYIDGDRLVAASKSADATRLIPLGEMGFTNLERAIKEANIPTAAVKLTHSKATNAVMAVGSASVIAEIAALVESGRGRASQSIEIVRAGKTN